MFNPVAVPSVTPPLARSDADPQSNVHSAAIKVTDRAAEDFRLHALTGDSFLARRTIFCQPGSLELDEISVESLRRQAEAGDE